MVYRRTQATEDRKGARQRLLLDSATRLFGQHGYHATSVPMIVAAAGISTGSFYMYFKNKEDVFNAALEELGKTITALMDQVEESQPDILKQFSESMEALFLYLAENPEQARILIVESSGLSPRLEKTRRNILRQQANDAQRTLESAPDVFEVENPTIAAQCVVGAAYEALYCWLEEDTKVRMPAVDVARAVARFTIQAVRRTKAKS
jgi:AcrR family transcriptional regulator